MLVSVCVNYREALIHRYFQPEVGGLVEGSRADRDGGGLGSVMKVRRALQRLEAMCLQGEVSPQAEEGLRSEYEAELRDHERRAAERRG